MNLSLATLSPPARAVPASAGDVDLLSPLPVALTGTHHGWFARYRCYPVFSRPWMRGRLRAWGVWLPGLAAVLVLPLTLTGDSGHPLVAAAGVALMLLFTVGVPLLLGPWLAWQVRRRGWPVRRELAALVAAFTLTVGVTTLLFDHVRPVLKNAVSQWVEGTEAGTTVVMLGLSVQRHPPGGGEAPGSGEPAAPA